MIFGGGANKIFGILFMGLILLYPACDYCSHRIEPAPRLEAYEMTILQTKTLIGERNINLQDMEITKTLAGVIKERNEYIASLKVAQRNPFCLFKPKMDVVNTIYQ